ncbi:MAG: hypothetical protein ABF743_03455 [Schleiferilactobacillus perolens]|nr:hypothetical protein [Schleiferilactobacillus perolens]MCI1911442.1 hypothetical protein [Schleiferilactobacillus harbinensis]
MTRNRRMPNFLSATVFIVGLALINLAIIALNDSLHSKALSFFGNTVGIGLLFPAVLLYIERKEHFNLRRYAYFAIMTTIAVSIITYLFVMRF